MAKARDIAIAGEEPFAAAGARVVRARADEVWEHADGVLDTSDIERVHDMRVATRRLRAVLEIFAPCFDRREHRAVLRDDKRLADALGERRDPDVHLEALGRLEREVPEDQRAGVRHLAALQAQRQRTGNDALAAALREADETDLRGRLERLA